MPLILLLPILVLVCADAAESILPDGWARVATQDPRAIAAIAADEPAPGGGPVVRLAAAEGAPAPWVRAASLAIAEPGGPLAADLMVRGARAGGMLTVCFYTDPRDGQHWYVTRLVPVTASWVRQRVVVSAPNGAEWAGRTLQLRLSVSQGEALVAGVALAPAPAPPPAPSASGRNRLANPGFDAGGGGWFLQAWPPQDATTGLPGPVGEGPDSAPFAMRLPGGGASLISTLMPFTPGRPCTLSLAVRLAPGADRNGRPVRIFLITPNWRIAQRTIPVAELDGSWKRFSVTFREGDQGSPYANCVYARIDPGVAIDVDSAQVEDGDAATAYHPGAQVGIDPPGDGGFLAPGAAELTAVVGLPGGSAVPLGLVARGLAITGEVLFERRVELPAGPEERRTVRIPVEHRREGVVACRLSLAGPDGAEVAAGDGRYAVFAGSPPSNPLIGFDDQPMRDGLPLLRRSEAVAARLGLGFRRAFVDLSEGDGPDPHLAYARSAFAEQHRQARVMIVLDPAAGSSLSLGRMRKLGVAPGEDELARDIPRFAAAFAATAQALAGVVDEIEMLNEPNIWTVRGAAMMPPERYVRLLQAVRPAMRAAAPGVRLALNVNGVDTAYVGAVAALGGLQLVDLVTVHAYRANPEHAPIIADLARMRALIDRFVPGMPIVNSEQYYGLLGHGIGQGEYDRNYCGEDEADITGRTLQTVLHGLTVGAPFGLLTHGSGVCMHTPFGAPWLYQAAGGMRAIAGLAQGVTGGRDIPVHDAVRALLLARGDGSHLVAVNSRVFGEHGTMGRPAGCSAADVDGNPLDRTELPIGYLPTYLLFPAGIGAEAVVQAVQTAAWHGFSFPVELTAVRGVDGRVVVRARNRERQPVQARVSWPGRGSAGPWQVDLPAAGSAETTLDAAGLRWQDDPDLAYEISCGEILDAGRLRIPVLIVPRLPVTDPTVWEPETWLELGEDRLSADFAPERPHRGPADLAAHIALAWSPDGLHLMARVDDDAVVTGPNHGGDAWARDSLQLYVDQRAGARSARALPDGGCAAWILGRDDAGAGFAWLDLAPTGRYVGAANATTGLDPLPRVAWLRRDGGWECRATVPPAALPALDLQPGSVCGLSLLINDDDGQGRKRGLTLGPAGTEPIGRPWLWKRCQLGR